MGNELTAGLTEGLSPFQQLSDDLSWNWNIGLSFLKRKQKYKEYGLFLTCFRFHPCLTGKTQELIYQKQFDNTRSTKGWTGIEEIQYLTSAPTHMHHQDLFFFFMF